MEKGMAFSKEFRIKCNAHAFKQEKTSGVRREENWSSKIKSILPSPKLDSYKGQ